MKIVINVAYGGFSLPKEFCKKYHIDNPYSNGEYDRYSPELIEFVEQNPDKCSSLRVTRIPEEATDYFINEYDGAEEVIYVLDGKLHWEEYDE